MDDCIIFEALGQVSSREAGEIFRNFLRGGVRQMISEVMATVVEALCDPSIGLPAMLVFELAPAADVS